ncbi:membrane dipeptidase [Rhodococcus fascians]|nr:membrane dipeptidase [Rhodococcus fascians]
MTSPRVRATPPFWDQHTCPPLQRDATIESLIRYRRRGGALVSVNAGYSPHRFTDTVDRLRRFRTAIEGHSGTQCASTIADVDLITTENRTAVVFDLEDAAPLDGDLDNLSALADLGVRTILPTYNHSNLAGGGCLDDGGGLTDWGRSLVAEMNAVGIVPDGSHCSTRTGLDMCEVSRGPVIYSHSCMRSVWEHPRNITDDQARASAAGGGVIGITGVGIFLGPNTPTLDALTRHLEYAVDLIGIDHVGLSSDFSFDQADFLDELIRTPHLFDESYTRWGPIQWMPPEDLLAIAEHLSGRGWTEADVQAVTWRNFYRVAEQVWL